MNVNFEIWMLRLGRRPHPGVLGTVGVVLLLLGIQAHRSIQGRTRLLQQDLNTLTRAQYQSASAMEHYESLADLKTQDVQSFRDGLLGMAKSKKSLYEAGLSTQEERRLLEKQWDILITYMTIQIPLQRIFLMRGDQPLESYLMNYVPLKVFGGLPATVPRIARIVSKERFAHPERGKSEMVNGKLQWEPPQVGTSVRSNALGEYVIFTNSRLILHGPPKNEVDHEAFPHLCIGLSLEAARNLYQHSYIGTKIVLTNIREELDRQASFAVSVDTKNAAPPPEANAN